MARANLQGIGYGTITTTGAGSATAISGSVLGFYSADGATGVGTAASTGLRGTTGIKGITGIVGPGGNTVNNGTFVVGPAGTSGIAPTLTFVNGLLVGVQAQA